MFYQAARFAATHRLGCNFSHMNNHNHFLSPDACWNSIQLPNSPEEECIDTDLKNVFEKSTIKYSLLIIM